jgi:phosphoglycolate phosphatase
MSGPFAPAPGLRLVLFDLDGTLVDSAPDIAVAVNLLMARHEMARHSLEAVRGMIGDGIEALVRRAFAANGAEFDGEALAARHQEMLAIYAAHLVDLTTVRTGAADAVRASRACGLATGVVTNKAERFSRTILDAFGLLGDLDLVIGGDSGFARKPAPDMLLAACRSVGCQPDAALLIGDSAADLRSARAAGMPCILVRGGYSATPVDELGADWVIAEPGEFLDALSRAPAPKPEPPGEIAAGEPRVNEAP